MDSINGFDKIKTTSEKITKEGPRKEILFDGYLYDVTNFIKRHPGGNIISFYAKAGEDSTVPIQQFHNRSMKRVEEIINTFKKRRLTDSDGNINV